MSATDASSTGVISTPSPRTVTLASDSDSCSVPLYFCTWAPSSEICRSWPVFHDDTLSWLIIRPEFSALSVSWITVRYLLPMLGASPGSPETTPTRLPRARISAEASTLVIEGFIAATSARTSATLVSTADEPPAFCLMMILASSVIGMPSTEPAVVSVAVISRSAVVAASLKVSCVVPLLPETALGVHHDAEGSLSVSVQLPDDTTSTASVVHSS